MLLTICPADWRGIVVTVQAGGQVSAKFAEPISL